MFHHVCSQFDCDSQTFCIIWGYVRCISISVLPNGFISHRGMFKCSLGGIWVAPVATDILGGPQYSLICFGMLGFGVYLGAARHLKCMWDVFGIYLVFEIRLSYIWFTYGNVGIVGYMLRHIWTYVDQYIGTCIWRRKYIYIYGHGYIYRERDTETADWTYSDLFELWSHVN